MAASGLATSQQNAGGFSLRWRRLALVLGLLAVAGLAVGLEVPLCPTAALLGLPCPGCGLTRATLALLRGDLRAALALHPLVWVLAPLYFGLLLVAARSYVAPGATRSPPWINARWTTRFGWVLLALVLGVWIARFFGAFGGPVPVRSLQNAPFAHAFGTRSPHEDDALFPRPRTFRH